MFGPEQDEEVKSYIWLCIFSYIRDCFEPSFFSPGENVTYSLHLKPSFAFFSLKILYRCIFIVQHGSFQKDIPVQV